MLPTGSEVEMRVSQTDHRQRLQIQVVLDWKQCWNWWSGNFDC